MRRFKHHKNGLDFLVMLSGYKPWAMALRWLAVSLLGIATIQMIKHTIGIPAVELPIENYHYFLAIFFYNLLGELYIALDNVLDGYYPVPESIKKRFFIQLSLSIILVSSVSVMAYTIFNEISHINPGPAFYLGIATGLIFVTTLACFLIVTRLMVKWLGAQKQLTEMKQEKLKMDYTYLQDQLNPHFLFNNLSVLKSLIIYDKKTAVKFTENFTDVYRYVLQSNGKEMVSLDHELEFINSYLDLHKERLGEGLETEITIADEALQKNIAPLTLQLLVENVIKHNIASKDEPLVIKIKADINTITVENMVHKKETSYSTHTGLRNLTTRYKLLTERNVTIEEQNNIFRVAVPLL